MNFSEYQKESYKAIQPHTDQKDAILNWAIGLSEETGEVIGLIKHKYWSKEEPKREEVIKEMGDVLWYLSALAVELDVNLEAVASLNVAKLKNRYDKGVFSTKDSQDRHLKETKFEQTETFKNIINNSTVKEFL